MTQIYVQGADADGTGNPDSTTFTNWLLIFTDRNLGQTANFGAMNGNAINTGGSPAGTTPTPGVMVNGLLNAVDRMRFLRFHVVFTNDSTLSVVGNPDVSSIRIDFKN